MTFNPERLSEIVRPFATVSDRIRALDGAGVPRADIARFLGKRYQHVRNVLEGDAQQGGGYVLGRADLSGVAETPATYDAELDDKANVERRGSSIYWLTVRPDGSIFLPKAVAEAFGVRPGDRIFGLVDGEEFKLASAETAADRAREMTRRIVPPGVSMVDSLLADRRAEAAMEDDDE